MADEEVRNTIARIVPPHLQDQHNCNWPRCPTKVPTDMWGCRTHWYQLPPEIRRPIWRTYDPKNPLAPEYVRHFEAAQAWIRENHPDLFKPIVGNEYHNKGAPFEDPFDD